MQLKMYYLPSTLLSFWLLNAAAGVSQSADWIVNRQEQKSTLETNVPGYVTLQNGLISRTFSISPCFGTVEYMLVQQRRTFFRALSPEGTATFNGSLFEVKKRRAATLVATSILTLSKRSLAVVEARLPAIMSSGSLM